MLNQRVLITGGAGLIGSHLADLAVQEGASEIIVLDNFVRGRRENLAWAAANGRVSIVEGDICNGALLRELMEGVDVLFHQAALRITQCAAEPRLAMDVLVHGTFNVFEAAVEAKVARTVFASSASVYGLADEFPTGEWHHPYNNRTLYGAAKAFAEGLARSFHEMHGLNYVGLRYFNVYGPRMDVHGAYTEVLIRWMERIAAGRPPIIFGEGTETMDFVHVADVARANILAAKAAVSDEVFNIGTGVETSLLKLATLLLDVMGSTVRPEHAPARKVNPVPRRVADVRRARERLGFVAARPLAAGLRELAGWWQKERCGVPA